MYNREKYEATRQVENDRSRNKANHHREEWSADELAFLKSEWVDVPAEERDEATVAEVLERTIEACRNQAHYLRHGKRSQSRTTTATTTTRIDLPGGSFTVRETHSVDEYIGAADDDEDRWWEPSFYKGGE